MIIKNKQDEIESYLVDAANYKGFCSAVYFPESVKDIQNIFLEANKTQTPVTVAGNRTGITGGAIPEGGIVISTEKLNRVISLSDSSIEVESGILLADLQDYVEARSLFYPPDPTERNCFIGGNIATNASGAKTLKYGPTRNFVEALKMVLPTGDLLHVRRGEILADDRKLEFTTQSGKDYSVTLPEIKMPLTKHAAGYFIKPNMDLIDLFIGSEGTLGVIAEAELKILPLPKHTLSSVIFFPSENDALSFIMESDSNNTIHPSGMEFFDKYSLDFLRSEFPNIPENLQAAVWFEQDDINDSEETLNNWLEYIEKYHGDIETSWIATNESERNKFKDVRHTVSWKVNEYMAGRGLRKVGTDTAVPKEHFIEFYNFINGIAKESNIQYLIYGHFGNHHPHLNLLPKDESEFIRAKEIYGVICRKAIELNGTISAEHGIGKMKHSYLIDMFGEEHIKDMAKIKRTLDPNGLLGVGNIFDKKYLAL